MKQKHRKAIYLVLASIIGVIFFPIWIIASITSWISNSVVEASDILKYLLRIYDEDIPTLKNNNNEQQTKTQRSNPSSRS